MRIGHIVNIIIGRREGQAETLCKLAGKHGKARLDRQVKAIKHLSYGKYILGLL